MNEQEIVNARAEYAAQLFEDGYTAVHAERMAKLAYPTKREASLRKARAARKRSGNDKRDQD